MIRTRSLWMLAVVIGASCVWWTGLRADDDAAIASPSSQVAELLARIEKLERRVEALEGRPQASRQIDTLFEQTVGALPAPWIADKPALSHGALILPPKAERPPGGAFLPRHIKFTPE
jgi:outer membrane murein-binding lipoprotein Lpp